MKLLPTLTIAVCISGITAGPLLADYTSGLKAYRNKNYALALKEFKAAGGKDSNYNLGVMYFKGEGVKPDRLQGLEFFKKAAEQGHANAQFILGTLYDKGEDVLQDRAVAANWYRKAADHGRDKAHFHLSLVATQGGGRENGPQASVQVPYTSPL